MTAFWSQMKCTGLIYMIEIVYLHSYPRQREIISGMQIY